MICCLLEFLAHLDFESFVCFFLSLPIFWSHFGRLACCLRFFGDYFCFGDCPKGKVLGKKLERLHELLSVCFFWHLLFEGFVCFFVSFDVMRSSREFGVLSSFLRDRLSFETASLFCF